MPDTIDRFTDLYEFLSNFYFCPMEVTVAHGNEISTFTCNTVEHYFQAMKSDNINDFRSILSAKSPGMAKRLGRNVRLRTDWEDVKVEVMKYALRVKFVNNKRMRKALSDTGISKLVEGNTWHDNYWGNCICADCENKRIRALFPKERHLETYFGQNVLGKLLMMIRAEIQYDEGQSIAR